MEKCPKCNSADVAEICYGYPGPDAMDDIEKELKEGKIKLGGCCIEPDSPKWECNACEWQFGKVDYDT